MAEEKTNNEILRLRDRLRKEFNTITNITCVIEDKLLNRSKVADLTLGELHVIEVVHDEHPIKTSKIAKYLHITTGALMTCLDRIIEKGYLTRTEDENDKRVKLINITQKGRKAIKIHDEFHENLLDKLSMKIDLHDLEKVVKLIDEEIKSLSEDNK